MVQKTMQDVKSSCENFSETLLLQMDEKLDGMDSVHQAGKCSQPITRIDLYCASTNLSELI